jgi:hypothetical protein
MTEKSCHMRRASIALVLFALTAVHGVELLNADFETLKSRLIGPPLREGSSATSTWSFTENGKSYDATFEAVAHGHAILERNSGFIAVYHPDGVHSLLMTLYTRDGNQPRLRAKGFGENPNQVIFVFQDITNWKKERTISTISSSFLKIAIT